MDITPPIPNNPADFISYFPPSQVEDLILKGDPTISKVMGAEVLDETTILVKLYHPESGEYSCRIPSSAKRTINNFEVNQIYTLRAIVHWVNDTASLIYLKMEWAAVGFEQVVEVAHFLEAKYIKNE